MRQKMLTGIGMGYSLCSTCTKYLLEELAGQLYRTSMLFPAKGATVLPLQFLFWGGFGGSSKGCSLCICSYPVIIKIELAKKTAYSQNPYASTYSLCLKMLHRHTYASTYTYKHIIREIQNVKHAPDPS
jgi:hypothetical protein